MPANPSRCSLSSARRATSNLQPSRPGPKTERTPVFLRCWDVEMFQGFFFLFFFFLSPSRTSFLWSFLQSLLLGAGRCVGCIEERQIWDLYDQVWSWISYVFLWWPAMPLFFWCVYGVWDGWNCNWDISWSTLESMQRFLDILIFWYSGISIGMYIT